MKITSKFALHQQTRLKFVNITVHCVRIQNTECNNQFKLSCNESPFTLLYISSNHVNMFITKCKQNKQKQNTAHNTKKQ